MKLEDVCKKASSAIAQKDLEGCDGEYPIFGASGFIKNVDFYAQEEPYIAVVKDGAGVGRVMKLPAKSSVIGTMQYIIPNKNIDIDYLMYAMQYMNLGKYYMGATIPHIYFKDYCKETLPDHSDVEQRRIGSILNKTESLILLRQQQLAKLNEFIKSRFVEMFGDLISNPKHWQIVDIKSVIRSLEAGNSVNGESRLPKEGEIAVLKVSAVTQGVFNPLECKTITEKNTIKKFVHPRKGDLLFSRANTRELVGATCIVYEDYPNLILPDKLWKILLKEEANVFYIKHVLSTPTLRDQMSFQSTGTSGTMYNISMKKFENLLIPLPPIVLQNQFAAFVEQTEKTKSAIKQSLHHLETLKKSLMQEFFA